VSWQRPDPFTPTLRTVMKFYRPFGVEPIRLRKAAENLPIWAHVFLLTTFSCCAVFAAYALLVGLPLEYRNRILPTWYVALLALFSAYFSGVPIISLIVKRRLIRSLQDLASSNRDD